MPNFRIVISGLCCAILAGCGGSGNGSDEVTLDEFIEILEREGLATDVGEDDLPSEATLNGYFFLEEEIPSVLEDGEVVVGELSVDADFAAATIGGDGTDIGIYSTSGSCPDGDDCEADLTQSLDGSLILAGTITSDAVSTTASGTLAGEISGSAEDPDSGSSGTFVADVSVEVDGEFVQDDDGLLFVADLDGTAEAEFTFGSDTTSETLDLGGEAIAAE